MKQHLVCVLAGLMLNLLVLSLTSPAKEDTWTTKADIPDPKAWFSTTAVNGKIYVIGGWSSAPSVAEYDPMTGIWSRKANSSTGRTVPTIAVNGKIYAIGGWIDPIGPVLSLVEEYDPATDTWVKKADMPTPRWGLSLSVVNGKIYAIGGRGYPSPNALATVEEYDPVTDTWTKKADMPTPRTEAANNAPTVNGKIYFIGGSLAGYPRAGEVGVSTVEEYDPATDTWAKKADMPTPRAIMAISEVKGKIYVIGGCPNRSIALQTVEEYDPTTDTWTRKADMPTARFALSASEVNGYIYAIGGQISSGSGRGPSMTVEVYDTGTGILVTAISPLEGKVTGNEPIAISGSGFTSETNVTIGGKPLEQVKVTDKLILGLTPSGNEGEQEIRITAPCLDFSILAGKFFYKPISNITVTSMIPNNGKQAGGDIGNITGSGFMTGATVTIGGVQANNVNVVPTLITFSIPPGTEGEKKVVVTNPDGQKGILRGGYTYNPFPVIEEVTPDGGSLSGGTDLLITGSNFIQDCVVYIGESRATRLDFFSPTELRLKTSSGPQGIKDVRVINPDGQDAILEDGFTYNWPPYISSIEPNMGALEGGTRVTIKGGRFIFPLIVFFGDAEAGVRDVTAERIIAETKLSTAGVKDVTVINPDGQRGMLRDAFTYNPAPRIGRVTPDNGRLAGGTRITIQGDGFLPGARVLFGKEGGTYMVSPSVEVMSGSIITAITPPGSPGPKDVMLENPDRQIIILPDGFHYNLMPTIARITPNYGLSGGGAKVVVEGTGFLQGARVMIGEKPAISQMKDDTTIEAVMPPLPQGVWDIRVINPDTQEVVKPRGFITVGELAYNYPNPFRASQGTTFRYVSNESVDSITVKIFNLAGVPIDIVRQDNSYEVRWQDSQIHEGMYLYVMEVNLGNGGKKQFKKTLEVYK